MRLYWLKLQNIERELKKAEAIALNEKMEDQFQKVEDQLSDFHGGLLAFFTVDERIDGLDYQDFYYGFETALEWVGYFLHIVKRFPEMSESSKALSKVFAEMDEAHNEYLEGMHEAGCLWNHAELVEEAVADDFNSRLNILQNEYMNLAEEFIEKLDALIVKNSIFRISEKVPS